MTKRRAAGEGNLYRRADGLWVGRLSLGYDSNGRRRRKAAYGKTQREVREKLARLQAEIDAGIAVDGKAITVRDLLDDWLRHGREIKDWTPMTARGYETIARSHLIPALGRHRLDRLTTRHVQRLLDELNASGRAPGTIQNVRAALNSALELGVKWQLVSRNVAANAEVPRITRRSIEPLSLAEAHRFLEAVAEHRLGPLFTVATALGLRQSEALALRLGDIDLDESLLHVRRRTYRVDGQWHTGRTKTDRERTIPFPTEVEAALRRQRASVAEERLLSSAAWADADLDPDERLVFPNTTGGPLYGPYVTRTMQALMRDAGIEPKRFHDLRHTAATMMLAMGVRLEVIQEVLGHASFRTTRDIYAHILPELTRDASDKIGAFLRGDF